MKKINVIVTTIVLVSSFLGYSQDTLRISKKELTEQIMAQNLQIKIANQEFKAAQADYRQSNALFLPSITASHTAISTTNPLMAFGSKLNQAILTAADFNPDLLNNPATTQNFATKIEILQPIINLDGLYGRQAAKAKMNAYQLQTERTKEYLALEVKKAYMQLQLAYKAVQVLNNAAATAEANLKLVSNYYQQGMLQKTDLLAVQVRVNEIQNQLHFAKSNIQNASDYLSFLLNESPKNIVYKPTDEFSSTSITLQEELILPAQRKDILAMDETEKAYQKMVQSNQMNFLPRMNAFGSYEAYDTSLFGMGADGYLIGAQLSWTLFDGYKSIGKKEKAKAEYQKSTIENQQYKAKSQLELDKALRQRKDAQNKVNLAQLALAQSEEAFRIRNNRFVQGLEKTTDLLQAETQKNQKELELLQALFEFNFTQEYIQFLTK